jgi:glycosyltransferase involved in cell wall biosynthesis
MAKICIILGAPLCRAPRSPKEAEALGEAGHDVVVLAPIFSERHYREDQIMEEEGSWSRCVPVDLRIEETPFWQRLYWRGLRRAGKEAVARLGWQSPSALGYGVGRMLSWARQEDADLYIGHQEVGLWVCARLLEEGHRVGADIEDWYSRDLPPEARQKRPVRLLERDEEILLRKGAHVTTTSVTMAEKLADMYGADPPEVTYNAFRWSTRDSIDGEWRDRQDETLPSCHWFSQTIGLDRGLETFFQALNHVDRSVAVHLRGSVSTSVERELRGLFPDEKGHKLNLHGLVPNHHLLNRIAEHDVGLALEKNVTASREYTITNKILQYLLGGLAVVATDTAGQREVAGKASGAVQTCEQEDPQDMARHLNRLLENPRRMEEKKDAALEAARETFCWERQIPTLLRSVNEALKL